MVHSEPKQLRAYGLGKRLFDSVLEDLELSSRAVAVVQEPLTQP